MDIKHYHIKTNGIKLHCAMSGQKGPVVIFLHGFPECWYSWRHQILALGNKFRVVAPDMRGYHKSAQPHGVMSYTMPKLLDDIQGLILALGEQQAIIIGHDWGGGIAWNLAMERAEAVQRLVVINCPHPAIYFQQIRSNWRQLLRSWYVLFFQLPWLPEYLLSINKAQLLRKMILHLAVQKEAWTEQDMAYLLNAVGNHDTLKNAINYYRAFARTIKKSGWLTRKTLADWPTIKVPTLLIWGEQDRLLCNELTHGMEPLFTKQLTVKYIENSGHWVQQENPILVNHFLNEFLSDISQS